MTSGFHTEPTSKFIIERIAAPPTRRERVRFGVWVALGLGVLAMIGLRMWSRHVSACSSN
jgi:hypothetical protein